METAYRTALENLKIHHEDAYHDYFFQGISDCIEDVSTPEITDEYADYFEKEAYPETLEAQQEFLNGIDNFCNWNIDFREKLLRFQFNDGGSKKFRIVPVGSFSKITNTWLWEWGNNDTDASGELSKLREF